MALKERTFIKEKNKGRRRSCNEHVTTNIKGWKSWTRNYFFWAETNKKVYLSNCLCSKNIELIICYHLPSPTEKVDHHIWPYLFLQDMGKHACQKKKNKIKLSVKTYKLLRYVSLRIFLQVLKQVGCFEIVHVSILASWYLQIPVSRKW